MKKTILNALIVAGITLFCFTTTAEASIAKGYYFIKTAYEYTNSEATIYDAKSEGLDVCRIHNCTYAAEDIFYIEEYETGKYIIQNAKTGRYMGTFSGNVQLTNQKSADLWMVIDEIDGGNIRIKASDQTYYYNWNGNQLNGGHPLDATYNYHDWRLEAVSNSVLASLGIDPTKTPSGSAIDDGDNTGGNTGGGDDDTSGIAKAYYFIKTAYTNASPEATIYDAKAEDLDICRIHNCTYAAEDIFYIEEYETGKYIIQNAKTGRYMGTFSGNVQLTDEKPTDIWMVIDQLDNGNIRIKASDQTCYYNWNGNQLNGGAGLNATYNYHDWKLELVPNSTLTNLGIDPTKNPSGEIIGPGGGGNEDPDDDDDPGILKSGFYYIESAYNSGYVSPHSAIYDPVEDDMLKIRVNSYSKAEIFLIKKIALGKYTMQNAQTGRYVVGYEGTNYIALGNKPMEERWLQFMNIKDGVWRFRDSDQTCFYNWNGSYVNGGAGLNSTYNYHDWSIIPVDADMLESLGLSGDSLVIDPSNVVEEDPYIDAMWQSLGTSITWYNNNVSSAFTKGYQTRVREVLPFKRFSNKGVNASCLGGTESQVTFANYYTIEHGINDWGHATPVGTIDDYINDTKNGTFAANYRKVIDKIYSVNPNAMIVLCTPRKGYGFGGYLPDNCEDANKGIYLHEYADVIRQIAEYESLPVADFYALCGNQHNLASLSIDKALHPNDNGYQLMADVLVKAMRKVLVHPIIVPEVKETEE